MEINHARNKSDLFPWFLPDYPEILINFLDFFLTLFRKSKFPDFSLTTLIWQAPWICNVKPSKLLNLFLGDRTIKMSMQSISWASGVQMCIRKIDFNEEKLKQYQHFHILVAPFKYYLFKIDLHIYALLWCLIYTSYVFLLIIIFSCRLTLIIFTFR